MLSNAVILILQETLEAALLISVLAAVCYLHRLGYSWLLRGLLIGLILASVYAANLQQVSEWFDYVGQEVVNASLQVSIGLLLVIFYAVLPPTLQSPADGGASTVADGTGAARLIAMVIVMLAITREGSEIVLYLGGLVRQQEHLQAGLMGSGVGFGIGLSIGFLLFYGLLGLAPRWAAYATAFLLALFAGNMLSQAVMQLIQADWLPASQALWVSSGWVPEQAVLGQLLYALIGYEATPPPQYVLAYLAGFLAVLAVILLRAWKHQRPAA